MAEAFAAWQAAAAAWVDLLHAGILGLFKVLAVLAVAWHGVRVAWGALTGNARRELMQGLWQLAVLGLAYKTVENPSLVWAATVAVVGGVSHLLTAPFGG